jgi:RNA polymerase sigma factor (TIGR02999 family)
MWQTSKPMSSQSPTELLNAWQSGDSKALAALAPLIEQELHYQARQFMRQERPDHTLQATALVNEAFMRLINHKQVPWQNRSHFFGVAAHLMRLILIDHARARRAEKRGGLLIKLSLDDVQEIAIDKCNIDILDLNTALEELANLCPRQCQIVECRYFSGLKIEETASVLDISPATVKRDWEFAKAWLFSRLTDGGKGSDL